MRAPIWAGVLAVLIGLPAASADILQLSSTLDSAAAEVDAVTAIADQTVEDITVTIEGLPVQRLPEIPVLELIPDPGTDAFEPQSGTASGRSTDMVDFPTPTVKEAAGPTAFVAALLAVGAWLSTKLPLTTETGRRLLRIALGAPLALFSRIQAAALLDNPVRQGLLAYVQGNPGASLRETQRSSGVAWGTAVYHLHRLEKEGQLVSMREGPHRRYWQRNSPEAARRTATAQLASSASRGLAQAILDQPGRPQTELAAAAGLSTATASRQLRRLEAAGLAVSVRAGRVRTYKPAASLEAALADVATALPLAPIAYLTVHDVANPPPAVIVS